MMSKKIKQDGFSSLFGLILLLALIGSVMYMFRMFENVATATEVNELLDSAGVSALKSGVDETSLREGVLRVDESTVINNFKKLVRDSNFQEYLNASNVGITAQVIEGTGDLLQVGGMNINSTRQQFYLVSTIRFSTPNLSKEDSNLTAVCSYFDIFKKEQTRINYTSEQDGKNYYVLHSVSRIILR